MCIYRDAAAAAAERLQYFLLCFPLGNASHFPLLLSVISIITHRALVDEDDDDDFATTRNYASINSATDVVFIRVFFFFFFSSSSSFWRTQNHGEKEAMCVSSSDKDTV